MNAVWDFLFGAEAGAWNTALGIVSGGIAIILFLWGIVTGGFKLLRGDTAKGQSELPKPMPRIGLPTGRRVIGRKGDLQALAQNLAAIDDTEPSAGVILSGQGGIGKSSLARAFAEGATGYDGVIWVDAATRQSTIDNLMALCPTVGQTRPETPQDADAKAVIAALSGQRWLFVYDNVESRDDIRGLIPQGHHLIVTTRQGEGWEGFTVQTAGVLAFDTKDGAAVTLLMAEAQRDDDTAGARALAEVLGGLPLGLVIAGGLIRKQGLAFDQYLAQVQQIIAKEPQNSDYPTSVIGAVRVSFEKLPEDAQTVAKLFAWWAPDGLEARLITDAPGGRWLHNAQWVSASVQALAQDPTRVSDAIEALAERALIRRDGTIYEMHRMTGAAIRTLQADASLHSDAAALLASVCPVDAIPTQVRPEFRRLVPHIRGLLESGAVRDLETGDFLFNQAAIYLGQIKDHALELAFARASLDYKLATFPEDHRLVAIGYTNLGTALMGTDDFQAAEDALRQAINLHATHRPGSIELAESHLIFGNLLFDLARKGEKALFAKSLAEYQQAKQIIAQHPDASAPLRAIVLEAMGGVREELGQLDAALDLSEAALSLWHQLDDPEDERLGRCLRLVGRLKVKIGRADQADEHLAEALRIFEKTVVDGRRHEPTQDATKWRVIANLVLASAGMDARARQAEAKRLAGTFALDLKELDREAQGFQITPQRGAE